MIPKQHLKTARRSSRVVALAGWLLVGLGLVIYIVNEVTIDIPALHYGLYAVMFTGGWLGLRNLR